MIIEVDGYFHQALLTGKKCSKKELKQKYLQAKALTTDIKELGNVFSLLHNFEQLPYDSEIQIDFVIDTDTDRIYSPSY
ncbi:hypothetical protein [Bacillus sp. FJAT-27445]|uniref:hypothetical protein n=1 Tax=Bacillus sp. FJAT-27445 TaxID=1679166 RepID=UPI0009EB8CB8|nr:hypothetical protein [Bacillus sp. FJAT-27445]